MTELLCSVTKILGYNNTVNASIRQNTGFVKCQRRTRKLILLEYCTQLIFCGIDAITDNYHNEERESEEALAFVPKSL